MEKWKNLICFFSLFILVIILLLLIGLVSPLTFTLLYNHNTQLLYYVFTEVGNFCVGTTTCNIIITKEKELTKNL